MKPIKYKGYEIYPNPFCLEDRPNEKFLFRNMNDCDEECGTGNSIGNCKLQIDEKP